MELFTIKPAIPDVHSRRISAGTIKCIHTKFLHKVDSNASLIANVLIWLINCWPPAALAVLVSTQLGLKWGEGQLHCNWLTHDPYLVVNGKFRVVNIREKNFCAKNFLYNCITCENAYSVYAIYLYLEEDTIKIVITAKGLWLHQALPVQ